MFNRWIRIASALVGAAALLTMLFADSIGLESFPTWGARRIAVASSGAFILIVSVLYRDHNLIGKTLRSKEGRFYPALVALNIGIVFIYLWFATSGLLKSLPNETNYYDLQANAFAKGQLNLDVAPDPALLAFKDESLYEPENRAGIPVLWDATLYDGKYYLYWGPAPALLITPVKFFYPKDLGDKFLTLAFLLGTLGFLNLIILGLWLRYFKELPHWAVICAAAFAGLVNPMPYVLVEGRIYEAAIVAAQFFLMGGFYFLLRGLDQTKLRDLFLAGSFFTFAIASRTTVLPAIALIGIILVLWAYQEQRQRLTPILVSFALPLLIGGAAYATYNHARFGSITEFGYRYQLTSYNLYQKIGETFSIEYLAPNLYKTLLNPLERRNAFPRIFPNRWSGPEWLTNYEPKMYLTFTENITGIFVSTPFVWLALLAFVKPRRDLRWVIASITFGFLAVFFTLQAFFFIAMRYLLDALPTLALLVILGYWRGFDIFKSRKVYAILTSLLLLYTIAVSLLISFSGNLETFRILNPGLVRELTWTFSPLIK